MEKLSEPLDVVATVGVEESEQKAEREIQKPDGARIYPMHLTQLVLDSNYCVEVRILASAKLKKNINAHWCSTAKGFVPPEMDSGDKETIKTLLLRGLRESNTEVTLLVSSYDSARRITVSRSISRSGKKLPRRYVQSQGTIRQKTARDLCKH